MQQKILLLVTVDLFRSSMILQTLTSARCSEIYVFMVAVRMCLECFDASVTKVTHLMQLVATAQVLFILATLS